MWKNSVQPDRPGMTIWHLRIACRISDSTKVHLECVILIDFLLELWLHERTSVLHLYLHCLSSKSFILNYLYLLSFTTQLFPKM